MRWSTSCEGGWKTAAVDDKTSSEMTAVCDAMDGTYLPVPLARPAT